MTITDFIGGGFKEMLGREAKCERCGVPFNPQWSQEDKIDRDVCEACYDIIGDEEKRNEN